MVDRDSASAAAIAPRHGGDPGAFGVAAETVLDFSANLNPLGPPAAVLAAVAKASIAAYPEPYARTLARALADRLHVPSSAVAVGAGSTELIYRVAQLMPAADVHIPVPTFSEYRPACEAAGHRVLATPWDQLAALNAAAAFVCNPNNPTGTLLPPTDLLRLADRSNFLCVDESLIDFVDDEASASLCTEAANRPGLVVLRSLTKWYAMPGLRVGYAVAHPELIARLDRRRDPWSVGAPAQAAAHAALGCTEHDGATRAWLGPARADLYRGLCALPGFTALRPAANFILARGPVPAAELRARLLTQGILIRGPEGFEGLPADAFRVAVRLPAENRRLVQALRTVTTKGEKTFPDAVLTDRAATSKTLAARRQERVPR